MRRLGSPGADIRDTPMQFIEADTVPWLLEVIGGKDFMLPVPQGKSKLADCGGIRVADDIDIQVEESVTVVIIEARANENITQVGAWSGIEIHIPLDAAHAPHVLYFEVGCVRPLQHLYGKSIGTGMHEFG